MQSFRESTYGKIGKGPDTAAKRTDKALVSKNRKRGNGFGEDSFGNVDLQKMQQMRPGEAETNGCRLKPRHLGKDEIGSF